MWYSTAAGLVFVKFPKHNLGGMCVNMANYTGISDNEDGKIEKNFNDSVNGVANNKIKIILVL